MGGGVGEQLHASDPCWCLMEDISMMYASLPVASLSLLQSADPSANIGRNRSMLGDIGPRLGRPMLALQSADVGRKQLTCGPTAPAKGIVLLNPARHSLHGSVCDLLISR